MYKVRQVLTFAALTTSDPICDRLPRVATTGLHKGSILCSLC